MPGERKVVEPNISPVLFKIGQPPVGCLRGAHEDLADARDAGGRLRERVAELEATNEQSLARQRALEADAARLEAKLQRRRREDARGPLGPVARDLDAAVEDEPAPSASASSASAPSATAPSAASSPLDSAASLADDEDLAGARRRGSLGERRPRLRFRPVLTTVPRRASRDSQIRPRYHTPHSGARRRPPSWCRRRRPSRWTATQRSVRST